MADINKSIAKRWTEPLIRNGWTPISTFFIDNYHKLRGGPDNDRITTSEAMLIVHLIRHKWDERCPHPTFSVIATRMGISPTAARNHARSLEAKNFLKRIPSQGSANLFDLNPLFKALERLYKEEEAKPKRADLQQDPTLAASNAGDQE